MLVYKSPHQFYLTVITSSEIRLPSKTSNVSVGLDVEIVQVDLTAAARIFKAFLHTQTIFGQPVVLVNNAGYAAPPRAIDFSDLRQKF